MKKQTIEKVRKICLAFPDAEESEKWGNPHFCVNKKIFAGCGDENGTPVIGFKLEITHALEIIEQPGFWKAPYVGKHGWVSMDASSVKNWKAVQEYILESYRLIAPKRSIAKLEK